MEFFDDTITGAKSPEKLDAWRTLTAAFRVLGGASPESISSFRSEMLNNEPSAHSKIAAGLKRGLLIRIDDEGRGEAVDKDDGVPIRVKENERRKIQEECKRIATEQLEVKQRENPMFGSW